MVKFSKAKKIQNKDDAVKDLTNRRQHYLLFTTGNTPFLTDSRKMHE